MKHIDIIIPTRNRWEKLQRCLRAIPREIVGITITVTVVCDGDCETAQKLLALNDGMVKRILLVREHSGSVFCRNLITQTVDDALIYGVDDIEFMPNSIEIAIEKMRKYYPDGDGVVGFNYVGSSQSKAATCLVGQKFLRRYPQRKLFYPEYFHFSCQEIERLAGKLDKLHFEEDAKIHHYHPMKDHSAMDRTHAEARVHRKRDLKLSSERRANGLIWGDK